MKSSSVICTTRVERKGLAAAPHLLFVGGSHVFGLQQLLGQLGQFRGVSVLQLRVELLVLAFLLLQFGSQPDGEIVTGVVIHSSEIRRDRII